VTFIVDLIPVGLQRPGLRSWTTKPKFIKHETDNTRVGANARMHNNWLKGGARDGNGNQTQTSFHFVVDGGIKGQSAGGTIIQNVPVGEVTWQAADGFGPGNYDTVSEEQCVNSDGDEMRARRNAQYLEAGILKALGHQVDALGTHWDYNDVYADPNDPNRHHCPNHLLFRDKVWPAYKNEVGQLLHPDPAIIFTPASLPIWWSDTSLNTPIDRVWKGVTFHYNRTTYTAAKEGVLAHSVASDRGPLTRKPLKLGEQFEGVYRFKSGGVWWILTKYGSRIRASHCTPWITISDTPTAEAA
jgi:hypothetical protein